MQVKRTGQGPKLQSQSHQRWEDALGGTAGHREPAVRAGVAGRQRLAEVVRWLLAHDPHLRGQVRIVLLLLRNNRNRKNPHVVEAREQCTSSTPFDDLLGSVAAASSGRTLHPSPHPPVAHKQSSTSVGSEMNRSRSKRDLRELEDCAHAL
jgi:hypothetical protein